MNKFIFPLLLIAFLLVQSCRDSVNNINTPVYSPYKEIVSVNIGDVNIKLYINGGDSLTSGYNDVFLKVWKSSVQQSGGFVKLFPKMWMTPTYMHSTAVSERFEYDNTTGYYKGYIIFNMVTAPPDVIWHTVFTYVDENNVSYISDSIPLFNKLDENKQWRFIYDSYDQSTYMVSIANPFNPVLGMNNLKIILHKPDSMLIYHEQIKNAQMSVCVYKADSTNIQSSGNVNPAAVNGFYEGKINLPYKGKWMLCDSIFYNNRWITNNPPPLPEFFFEVK